MNSSPGHAKSGLRIALVDLSGETNILYTPLAILCMKAAVEADVRLVGRVRAMIGEFTQAHTSADIVRAVIDGSPDVVAMSCQGWNFRQLSATFGPIRQFLPNALVVLGGNHVSHRGARLLPAYPDVDVVVNGEGEATLCDLLTALLHGVDREHLDEVAGLTFRRGSGIVTTKERPRSRALGEFPSPYALLDVDFRRYDVALMETNRGCPYKCGFCYWGGRIGQRIARSEVERAYEELEVIGRAGISTIFLCDANVGILPEDVEIARMIVDLHARYGVPREVQINWAKNHAGRVGEIVRILRDGGVHTPINVPLQTLSARALALAGRTETGRADMMRLADELVAEGTEVYCEMIFGLPGESFAEFKTNYDALYAKFPALRIHPLWLLPNTEYDEHRRELGICTLSPDPTSDYEAVISHLDMDLASMEDGLAMLLAHEMLSLLGSARDALRLLARHDGRSVAEIVCGFEGFLRDRPEPLAQELYALFVRIRRACYFERVLRAKKRALLYRSRESTHDLIRAYLEARGIPSEIDVAVRDLLRYNCLLLPRKDLESEGVTESEHDFHCDPIELSLRLVRGDPDWAEWLHAAPPTRVTMAHRSGLAKLDDRNCDLTGMWHGRVVARVPPARGTPERRREQTALA